MMKYSIICSAILTFFLAGCGKDKFETKPNLTFTSVNTTTLRSGQLLQFTLTFTDKEGDISDSLWVRNVSDCGTSNFTTKYKVPNFPASSNQKGEIIFTLGFNAGTEFPDISPKCGRDETAVFSFVLSDLKNNVSDTVSSPPIKIIYQ